MAIVAHLFIPAAGTDEHALLQQAIEAEIVANGAPPGAPPPTTRRASMCTFR